MRVNIVALDKIIFQGEVEGIVLPTKIGVITVLPKHIPLISVLTKGEITLLNKERKKIFIEEGILMVKKEEVNILVTVIKTP